MGIFYIIFSFINNSFILVENTCILNYTNNQASLVYKLCILLPIIICSIYCLIVIIWGRFVVTDKTEKCKQLIKEAKTSNKKEVIADFVKLMGKEKARITEEKKRLAKENTLEKILERKRKIIVVGAEVRMTGTKQKGTVIEITGNKARVEFGMIKSVISLENLELA